jgi:DNA anti-recombination protein RmuC
MKATQDKGTAEEEGSANADPPAGGASIDKVRDILFGGQMRDYDRRFARLEERLARDTSDLKEDVKKRLAALEQYVKQEIDALGERLSAEHAGREEAVKSLGEELRESAKSIDRRTAAMDDQSAKAQRDLRQQLLDQHQRLTDELQSRHQELLAALGRESSELRDEKADRAALAALFTEMAMRLSDQFRLPTPEGD